MTGLLEGPSIEIQLNQSIQSRQCLYTFFQILRMNFKPTIILLQCNTLNVSSHFQIPTQAHIATLYSASFTAQCPTEKGEMKTFTGKSQVQQVSIHWLKVIEWKVIIIYKRERTTQSEPIYEWFTGYRSDLNIFFFLKGFLSLIVSNWYKKKQRCLIGFDQNWFLISSMLVNTLFQTKCTFLIRLDHRTTF